MLLLSIIIFGVSMNSRLKSVAPTTRWPDFLLRDSNNPNLIRFWLQKRTPADQTRAWMTANVLRRQTVIGATVNMDSLEKTVKVSLHKVM